MTVEIIQEKKKRETNEVNIYQFGRKSNIHLLWFVPIALVFLFILYEFQQ